MNKLFKFFLIAFVLFFSVSPVFAQSQNSGFLKENIWYSKDPLVEGQNVKIYTLVFNSEDRELSGNVAFFDNMTLLGRQDFVVAPKEVEDISIDWLVTSGSHKIFAKIENPKLLISKGKYEDIYIKDDETEKSSRTAIKDLSLPDLPEIADTLKGNFSVDNIVTPVTNTGAKIIEKIPDSIKEPVSNLFESIDTFRENAEKSTKDLEEKVSAQIEASKNPTTTSSENSHEANTSTDSTEQPQKVTKNTKDDLLKPFRYLELFLLNLLSFVFETKWLFYTLGVLFALVIVKYIWNRFF